MPKQNEGKCITEGCDGIVVTTEGECAACDKRSSGEGSTSSGPDTDTSVHKTADVAESRAGA